MRLYDLVPLSVATLVVVATFIYDRWRVRKNTKARDE